MALMNCPECERKISDKAVSCPHCGYPLARERGRELLFDPLAELAEMAETSIRHLREALGPRREEKKGEEEKPEE